MNRGEMSLSAAAVAARLRRFWLGEAPNRAVVRRSDLGEVWRDIAVIRTGTTMVLHTPYDFGSGDPLEGGVGDYLRRRVKALSDGTVRGVEWTYDEAVGKPLHRARTTDLDIHWPGDPGLEEYDAVLQRVRKAVPADTSEAAREVLRRLRLAGVSRHRLWFAAPDEDAELAVRRTPGAAYALHAAVQRVQKATPLHRVVVDPDVEGERL